MAYPEKNSLFKMKRNYLILLLLQHFDLQIRKNGWLLNNSRLKDYDRTTHEIVK
jgi:hypothetical protein